MRSLIHPTILHTGIYQWMIKDNHHLLKQLKTDPFRKGVVIVIGRAVGPLCLLAAVLSYMAMRKPGKELLF